LREPMWRLHKRLYARWDNALCCFFIESFSGIV